MEALRKSAVSLVVFALFFCFSALVSYWPGAQTQGVHAQPPDQQLLLQDTPYPPPDPTEPFPPGYDAPPTNTVPAPAEATATFTATVPAQGAPAATQTPTATSAPVDQPTQSLTTETPASQTQTAPAVNPSTTAEVRETVTPTSPADGTITPTSGTPGPDEEGSSTGMDWGLFWIGFSLPVLVACGVVLYLLDRNPRLFARK